MHILLGYFNPKASFRLYELIPLASRLLFPTSLLGFHRLSKILECAERHGMRSAQKQQHRCALVILVALLLGLDFSVIIILLRLNLKTIVHHIYHKDGKHFAYIFQ